jgi:hypothetical protein
MSDPSDTFVEKVSNLLKTNWSSSGTGLLVTEVTWSHSKFETMNDIEKVDTKAIISTYNPQNPITYTPLTPMTDEVNEIVVVDLILHTAPFNEGASGVDVTVGVREKIRQLILQVIHTNQLKLSGANLVTVEGEFIRGELPQILREAFKVVIKYYETYSAPPIGA